MNDKYTVVSKIDKIYTGEDCIQTMIPYDKTLTVFIKDGIIYNDINNTDIVNTYTNDDRRLQFPYHNIPSHYERHGLFNTYKYVNQIMSFNEPYIRIVDQRVIEAFAFKDKDGAVLIRSVLDSKEPINYKLTRSQLEEFGKSNQNKYFISQTGISNELKILSEKEIYEEIKKAILKKTALLKEDYKKNNTLLYKYNDLFINYIEQNLCNLNNIIFDHELTKTLLVETNGKSINLRFLEINFVMNDCYNVTEHNIPINWYTYEQLIALVPPKINKNPESKIDLKLNPNIAKDEIKKAKQMVKDRRLQSKI